MGRGAAADLRFEGGGVWDKHLQLELQTGRGVVLTVLPGALASVNGHQLDEGILRNGDLIEAGAAKMRFWLGPTRQHSYRLREIITWSALGLLSAGQVWLVYRLMP